MQAERITGHKAKEIYVYRGYRGCNYEGVAAVYVAGRGRKKTALRRKWLRRRSVIEEVIGHCKTDGRLGMNFLKGRVGDTINAILSGI